MSDNISGHGSKSKKMARREFSAFLLLLNAKNRLSISEMVSAQCLQKVWAKLKKKWPYIFTDKEFYQRFSCLIQGHIYASINSLIRRNRLPWASTDIFLEVKSTQNFINSQGNSRNSVILIKNISIFSEFYNLKPGLWASNKSYVDPRCDFTHDLQNNRGSVFKETL